MGAGLFFNGEWQYDTILSAHIGGTLMAVLSCGNEECAKQISLSKIPGGNPAVALWPEDWASVVYECGSCNRRLCETCVKPCGGIDSYFSKLQCPACKGEVKRLREITFLGETYPL